jgi:hypothetical protein
LEPAWNAIALQSRKISQHPVDPPSRRASLGQISGVDGQLGSLTTRHVLATLRKRFPFGERLESTMATKVLVLLGTKKGTFILDSDVERRS